MKRPLRVVATLLVTAAAVVYIVSKVDLGKTAHIIGSASIPWLVLSALLTLVTVPPMAWRWQLLLRARGVDDTVAWLTRAYFVSYAFSQVLPTSVGGDAWRIFETSRRHPGNVTPVTGSVLLVAGIDDALLLCYHYDPSTGNYGTAVIDAIRIGAVATMLGLGTFLFVSLRKERTGH